MEQATQDRTHNLTPRRLEIIDAVALKPESAEDSWLNEIGRLIEVGSSDVTNTTTINEHEAIVTSRRKFAEKLGLTNPGHELNSAYERVARVMATGLKPILFLDAMATLSELTGTIQSATHVVQKSPYLLRHSSHSIRLRYAYAHRLATTLGWSRDVDEYIRERPKVLMSGHKKMMFLGQLAARFAKTDHKDIDHGQLDTIMNKPPELHMAGLLQEGTSYRFGQGVAKGIALSEWRERIYKSLGSQRVAERIGYRVVKAYLRQSRPSEADLKKYPYLAFLQRGRPAEKIEATKENTLTTISGSETWLQYTPVPLSAKGRKIWLTKINNYIEVGSQSIAGRKPGGDVYEEVVNARIMFFRLLGWTSPKTEIGKAYEAFANNYQQLIRPDRIVEVLNLFVDRRIPLDKKFLAGSFYNYKTPARRLAKRIDQIEALLYPLDAPTFIHDRPSILFVGESVLHRTLYDATDT